MNLSPLRSHKRRHNFIDTPSEICMYECVCVFCVKLYFLFFPFPFSNVVVIILALLGYGETFLPCNSFVFIILEDKIHKENKCPYM